MVYTAYELLARLRHLQLCGQNESGELEFMGTREQWNWTETEIDVYEHKD